MKFFFILLIGLPDDPGLEIQGYIIGKKNIRPLNYKYPGSMRYKIIALLMSLNIIGKTQKAMGWNIYKKI